MMHYHDGTFQGFAELELYYQQWCPVDAPRAALIIVPGLGGHSGLYSHVIEQVVPHGYAVYSFDMRGNGRSPGQRGYINAWNDYRQDLSAFVRRVKAQTEGCPLFLLGHSVGAVVALDYVLRSPEAAAELQGAIAFSPALGTMGVSPIKAFVGRVLSRVWPRFSLHSEIDPDTASRNPSISMANSQDPLRHDWVSARFATEFFATVDWVHTHAPDWPIPLLILHGGADQVALPDGGRRFFEHVSHPDKVYQEYPGAYHELQDDINYPVVMADLEHWMERHLPSECRPLTD